MSPARTFLLLVALSSLRATHALGLEEPTKPPRDPTAAEALYKTARDLLSKEDWAGACPKFAASMVLDPVASTLINVAKCSDHDGKIAQAWTELRRAKVLNQETQGEERKRTLAGVIDTTLVEIERRLPRLSLVVTPKAPGLVVTRNGIELPLAALDEPMPLDPGEHRLGVSAPGYDPVERVIMVEAAKLVAVDIRLSEARPAPEVPPAKPPGETTMGIPVWPFITGGLGLAAIGVGIGFRIDGMSAEANLDENCGAERRCDPSGPYDPSDDNQRKNVDFGTFMGLTIGGSAMLLGTAVGVIVEVVSTPAEDTPAVALLPYASEKSFGFAVVGSL